MGLWPKGGRASADSFGMRGQEAESPGKPALELHSFSILKSGEKALASTTVALPVSVLLKPGWRRAVN